MQTVDLSFNQSLVRGWTGRASSKSIRLLGALLTLISLMGLCWALNTLATLKASISRATTDLQQQTALRKKFVEPARKPLPGLPAHQLAQLNSAVVHLNTPWTAIFEGLENGWTPDVGLISIEPDVHTGRVRMVTEAKQLNTLYEHAQALAKTAPFSRVTLVKHEARDQDPLKPIRMTLDLQFQASPTAIGEVAP